MPDRFHDAGTDRYRTFYLTSRGRTPMLEAGAQRLRAERVSYLPADSRALRNLVDRRLQHHAAA